MYLRFRFVTAFLFVSFFVSAQVTSDTEMDDDGNYVNDSSQSDTSNSYPAGMVRVKDSIFMIKGRGGNIGFSVGQNGIFMIDDQFAEGSASILQRIRSVSAKPIELLVNTHHHGDHVGGNSSMSQLGTIIFSHENARKRMAEPYIKPAMVNHQKKVDSILKASGGKISSDKTRKEAYVAAEKAAGNVEDDINIPDGLLPVVSFNKDITFNYNGEKIMVIHIPNSHTDGDLMVYFTKSNVLHTGDAFVQGRYPFIDSENRGSLDGYVAGIEKILRYINEDTKIIPGHGEISSLADVKYTQGMLRFLKEKVKFHIVDKKTIEQVLAMTDLTKEYDDKGFGEGFITTEQFIRTLYNETAKKYGGRK